MLFVTMEDEHSLTRPRILIGAETKTYTNVSFQKSKLNLFHLTIFFIPGKWLADVIKVMASRTHSILSLSIRVISRCVF